MNSTTGQSGLQLEQAAREAAADDEVTDATGNHLPLPVPLQIAAIQPPRPEPDLLSSRPVVIIEPSKSWVPLNLRDLWAYRELLYYLTWRDIKVRYKQTLLGAAWAILQPLFMMAIATLIFGRVAGLDKKIPNIPYPLFAFAGVLPWTFFANALTNGGNSLVGSANLISKVYFPRLIVPAAAVAAGLVDFLIAMGLMLGMMLYYHVGISASIVMFPVLIVLLMLFALGCGLWLAALNVKYRDIRHALPFFIQAGVYIAPVYYPSYLLAHKWQWLIALNPLTGIIENLRAALFNLPFNWQTLGISTLITFVFLTYAAYSFRRMEKSFADIV